MAISKSKAYATYEKTESPKMKKAEMKKPEGSKEKARELNAGMKMMKKSAPKSMVKKMGKKK